MTVTIDNEIYELKLSYNVKGIKKYSLHSSTNEIFFTIDYDYYNYYNNLYYSNQKIDYNFVMNNAQYTLRLDISGLTGQVIYCTLWSECGLLYIFKVNRVYMHKFYDLDKLVSFITLFLSQITIQCTFAQARYYHRENMYN